MTSSRLVDNLLWVVPTVPDIFWYCQASILSLQPTSSRPKKYGVSLTMLTNCLSTGMITVPKPFSLLFLIVK